MPAPAPAKPAPCAWAAPSSLRSSPRGSGSFELREVELADRLVDQPAVVGVGERLPGHLRRGDQRQVGDLRADLLERAARLGLDLAVGLLHPPLPVDLGLLA